MNTKKLVAIVCRTAHIACLQQIAIEEPQSLLDIRLPLHGGGNHQLCLCLHNNYELLMQITLFPSICNTQHHAECTTGGPQLSYTTVSLTTSHIFLQPPHSTITYKHIFEIFLHNNTTDLGHTKYLLHVHTQKATITTTQLSCSIVFSNYITHPSCSSFSK